MSEENPLNPAAVDSLSKNLDALKASKTASEKTARPPTGNAGRAATDFLSAMAVCSLLGFGVDYFLKTSPWGLLVGLLAGTGIGAKLMMQVMNTDGKDS